LESNEVMRMLREALKEKKHSCRNYQEMLRQVTDQKTREIAEGILDREKKHLELLESIISRINSGRGFADFDPAKYVPNLQPVKNLGQLIQARQPWPEKKNPGVSEPKPRKSTVNIKFSR